MVIVVVSGAAEWVGVALLVASLPVVFGWGHVQAHVAFNDEIEEPQRTWWRVAIWCIPGAIALYWLLYVRSSRVPLK